MRKYTILHLEIRKLDVNDVASITIFFVICIGRLCLNIFSQPEKYNFIYDTGFTFLMIFIVVSSFASRFSSLYFSICWLLLSVLYIAESDRQLSYVSLLLLLLYHIVRFLFKLRYNIEFIAPETAKGRFISVYSELEGRESDGRDNSYMKILIWGAAFILFACLMLSGEKI